MKTRDQLIEELLNLAFAEDLGDGDHTTLFHNSRGRAGQKSTHHQGRGCALRS